MLRAMRRGSKSWVMKVILGLLALTFVAFFGGVGGLGGFSSGGHNRGGGQTGSVGNLNSLVQVGDIAIDARTVSNAYNQELRAISQLLGGQISPEQARQLGLIDQAIERLVAQALIDQGAADLGISISDEAVAQAVRSIPQLQSADGGFDPNLYAALLSQSGISEAQFINDVRGDLTRRQVLGTVQAATTAPFALVDTIYQYRQERRVVESVQIGAIDLPDLSEPTEAEIAAFYETAKNRFLAPEYRSVTVASLSPEQLAEQLTIDETELRIDYEVREAEFSSPERRAIAQAIFPDQQTAERARELIANGQPFATVVEEVSGAPAVELGQVTRADLLPELADASFTLSAGAVSDPVESPFGWHVALVKEIIPAGTRTFAEVRDELAADRALIEARDRIFEVMDAVTDAYAGGASLEDAVQENGLQRRTIAAVAANGTDPQGVPVAGLDPDGLMTRIAFSTGSGQDSDVVETSDGGFFVLRVGAITEPTPRPLAEVREAVAAAWQAQQIADGAQELANRLVDRVASGATLAGAAAELDLVADLSEPVLRTGEGDDLPPALIDLMFEGDVGDISVSPDSEGVVVGRLAEIVPATGATALVGLRNDLTRDVAIDIQTQLTAALRERYKVDIDRAALGGLFQVDLQQNPRPPHTAM